MADVETLEARLEAVEQAVTDGERAFPEATRLSDLETRLGTVEDRIEELGERADELDAATQALRGYVGNVRSVNTDVERRADAALAATERLEARLDDAVPQSSEGTDAARATTGRSHDERAQAGGDGTGRPRSLRSEVDEAADRPGALAHRIEGTDEEGEPGVLERVRRLL